MHLPPHMLPIRSKVFRHYVVPFPTVLELVEPHPLVPLAMPSEPEPLPVLEVSGRSQRRKRRSKGKQASAELLEIIK